VNALHRLTVPAVLALGIAVASPLLWLWPDDGVVDGWTVGVALWQAMPFALLLLFHRVGFSEVGTVVTAVVIAALTALGYVAVERDDSSTAGIALLFFPIYLAVLVVIAFFIDLGARRVVRRFANRRAEAS
jgi:Na+/melibiose symporter-like transporter